MTRPAAVETLMTPLDSAIHRASTFVGVAIGGGESPSERWWSSPAQAENEQNNKAIAAPNPPTCWHKRLICIPYLRDPAEIV